MDDWLVHCWTKLPRASNSMTLPGPASAAHRLPFWSTATPARLWKCPCGAVLPSIDARKVPSAVNLRTTLFPESPTNTLPFDEPGALPTAMLVGLENWPAPEPGMPAWHLEVQTSLFAAPSATPPPHAATNLLLELNFCTRALPLSATYTAPFGTWIAIPTGVWNWPAPEPGLPNESRNLRYEKTNVTSSPVAVPAEFA